MQVFVARDATEAGYVAAGLLSRVIRTHDSPVLGLATGSTPLSTWNALAEEGLDLSAVRAFALDEYVGLPPGHPQSYRSVIDREIVGRLGMTPELVYVPGGNVRLAAAGATYERAIKHAGGVNIQVLGIGRNGHIGFNEPGSSLRSTTRVVTLADETRADNSRFFGSLSEVPKRAITQGIGTILRAERLLLLAFGEAKSIAVERALEGPISARVPASAIQQHANVTVVLDEAAASRSRWHKRLGPASNRYLVSGGD